VEQVPCVLHRWFLGGENWAHHPRIDLAELQQIVTALDLTLKARQRGVFQVEVPGGVLIGELVADPDCPDRRARPRNPFLLRAALVPFRLDGQSTEGVLSSLRALPAFDAPGEHSNLTIPVALAGFPAFPVRPRSPRCAPARESSRCPFRARRRVWLLAGLVLPLGVALCVGLVSSFSVRSRSMGPSHPLQARAGSWDPPPPVFSEWIDRLDHPYTTYLRAYSPTRAAHSRTPPPTYEEWRVGEGQRAYRDLHRPLPSALRLQVEQHRRPADLVEPARAVAAALQRWAGHPVVPEPRADASSLRTFDAFFLHLSRPIGLPRPGELDHPRYRFLWRLPADPVAEGVVIENEADLARHLEELLRHLGGRPESGILGLGWRALLRQIEAELDYDSWLKRQQRENPFVLDDNSNPDPIVQNEFERRFGGLLRH
jgi:hypothetical protein